MREDQQADSAQDRHPEEAPGKYGDGVGLYLMVRRAGDGAGDRSWWFRYMRNGQARQLGLGPLHSVSLAGGPRIGRGRPVNACSTAAIRSRSGTRHPPPPRSSSSKLSPSGKLPSSSWKRSACSNSSNDTHRKQWRSTLETYAFPVIGDLPLAAIDSRDRAASLAASLEASAGNRHPAARRIERVFAWAKAHKLFDGENPASRDVLQAMRCQ